MLGMKMEIYFLKNLIQKSWSAKFLSVSPPQLGARSPPMIELCSTYTQGGVYI